MFIVSVIVFCILFQDSIGYNVPDVQIDTLSPKGLSVSIPDEEGISLFAFHGKVNEEMNGREAGTYSVDILKPQNGRWTYTNRGVKLKPGDVIYYWVNVDYDDGNGKRGYIKDDQSFTVTDLLQIDALGGILTTKPTTPKPTTTRSTRRPTSTKHPSQPTKCHYTPTIVNGKESCSKKLIFEENFKELSTRKWKKEIKFADQPDYEFTIYEDNPKNLYVIQNKLFITPSLTEGKYGHGFVTNSAGLDLGENCTGVPASLECRQKPQAFIILPPTISAQITTKDYFSFTYGIVEIRAQLPEGDWIYPELYLKSKLEPYGSGVESGLIRIAFAPGNTEFNKQLYGGCVLGSSEAARNYALKSIHSEHNWSNGFHIFRMEWKTDGIILMVDDTVYGSIYPPEDGFASERFQLELDSATVERWKKGSALAPFDSEMYLAIGVGVGGQCFADRSDGKKPWTNDDPKGQNYFYRARDTWSNTWDHKSALVVDYIKVWAL